MNAEDKLMQRNVLIVGGGRVGRHVAEQLSQDRNAVTVIELDEKRCDQISPKVSHVICGDGTDPDVLGEAALEEIDVFAALTNSTEINLAACQIVHEHAPEARTILRIARDGERSYGHRTFVDDIVYPAAAGADVAAGRITSL